MNAKSADELQKCLDTIASNESFRPSLLRIILLHSLAALLAAVVTFEGMPGHWWHESRWVVTAIEFLLVSAALWMSLRLNRKHTQETWIRCRFACELVRGLRASVPLVDPFHSEISQQDPEWRRFAISVGLLVVEQLDITDCRILRDRYLEKRLSAVHPDGQLLHYQKMRPAATWWLDFTEMASKLSTVIAPAFVLLSLLDLLSKHFAGDAWGFEESPFTWAFVGFLPIALPLIAGVGASLRQVLDAGRRRDRYPLMVTLLGRIKAELPGLETCSTIRAAVWRSEDLLLDELLEWQMAMKKAGD